MPNDSKASHISHATRGIFKALDLGDGTVSSQFFLSFLERNGLLRTDERLAGMMTYLTSINGKDANVDMNLEQFHDSIATCISLVQRCCQGQLVIPDFQQVVEQIQEIFAEVEPNVSGENAQYIPQLALVDPDQFAISITTIDGQHFSIGDAKKQFCIQSCSKPISYLIALKKFGAAYVHGHVGMEPSGRRFNEMCLKDAPSSSNPNRQVPHNPMINAGAIMTCSMVHPENKAEERLNSVLDTWRDLSAGMQTTEAIGYDDETYKSESGSADRNWCLAYMMKERGAYPACFTTLSSTLEIYFQICSILSTCQAMSVMASTLANGGLNPLTGNKVFTAQQVRSALPLMMSSGMYDYSGQWMYDIGIPAKSGVGGCVFLSIPNICGISIWSPRLDPVGNSARGVHAATEMVKRFAFHNFEVFSGLSQTKLDVTKPRRYAQKLSLASTLFAASEGDLQALTTQLHAGLDLYAGDYDSRTSLHLAASEGRWQITQFLVDNCPADRLSAVVNSADRWGATPLDDAIHSGCTQSQAILRQAGGQTGSQPSHVELKDDTQVNPEAPVIISLAAENDLDGLIRLAAKGHHLNVVDYDARSPMALAASNGHFRICKYLLVQCVDVAEKMRVLTFTDRWGNTPEQDAQRHGHQDCLEFLQQARHTASVASGTTSTAS
jgi:glutaminase